MYVRPRVRPKARTADLATWQAPTAGLIANRNLATPKGLDGRQAPGATILENFFPTARGAVMRRGHEEYAALPQREGNDTFTKVLLHMDGADASTTFTDDNAGGSAHTWTAAGNAQIDTADSKFGGASGLFDGTGDYVNTPDHADFTLGSSNFTIDLWFKCVAATGTSIYLAGQADAAGQGNANSAWRIARTSTNFIQFSVTSGTTITTVTGTTQFTNALNTGWHHVAAVRTGNVLKLFVDGVQEGGDTAFSSAINDSTGNLTVGRAGDTAIPTWNGWLDEFRMSVGIARWTENFTPPIVAYAVDAPTEVADLFTYNVGNQEELFAYCDGAFYDITVAASPAAVMSGLTAAGWVFVQFATSGGTFLVGVNGADRMMIYDGTFWYPVGASDLYSLPYDTGTVAFVLGGTVTGGTSGATGVIRNVDGTTAAGTLILDTVVGVFQNNETLTGSLGGSALANGTKTLKIAALTGVLTTALSYVWVYKNRLFFAEKDSLNAWYLALDAITGAATKIPLGGVVGLGGSLLFGSSWSIESADGLDARCVFFTTDGEAAVYAGINPSDANQWGLIGVYRIGVPRGKKAHIRAGGDVVIATDLGFVPLSVAVQRDIAAIAPAALSYPIEDDWSHHVQTATDDWLCIVWPSAQMVAVVVAVADEPDGHWLVANSRTGAWCHFHNWVAFSIAVHKDRLFFGTANGRVMEANVTGFDDGTTYTATYVPLFEDLRSPASLKVPNLARVVLRSPVDVSSALGMLFDFETDDLPTAPAAPLVAAGSVWGTGVWGASVWGEAAEPSIVQEWVSVGGRGYALAPALRISSGSTQPLDAEIVRIEAMYTKADVVS